jgi:hypothetical protein
MPNWYEQQGWEQMNKSDNSFINNHTTRGAQVGRHSNKSGKKRSIDHEAEEKERANLEEILKKETLQALLAERGLPTSANKPELVSRLLVAKQREKNQEIKKKLRESDPF